MKSIRNLMVTGGAGFIGTNFIRFLLKEGHFSGRIINVDKLTYAGHLENLAGIPEEFPDRYAFEQVDITDFKKLSEVFDRHEIDSLVHIAAESHVDRSIDRPADFIQANIIGTYNLLEIARAHSDRLIHFHHVSTDEVFGSLGGTGFFTENSPYRPSNPYSASKAAADHLVHAYWKTYELPITLSNCSNNYGPYQMPEKFVPLMILNALEGKSLPVYGDGGHIRDWLYVRDHCRAIWLVMQKGRPGESYNVGAHNEKSNLEVATQICDYLDQVKPNKKISPRKKLITFVEDRPGHDRRYAIDFSKLQEELHYQPEEPFESGLAKTIDWYLDNSRWLQSVTHGQYGDTI